jgi:hypothetical protein
LPNSVTLLSRLAIPESGLGVVLRNGKADLVEIPQLLLRRSVAIGSSLFNVFKEFDVGAIRCRRRALLCQCAGRCND